MTARIRRGASFLLILSVVLWAAGCAHEEKPITPEQIMSTPDAKMRSVVLTNVEILNANLVDALRYLTEQSREADPDKVGVTIVFKNFQLNEIPPRVTVRFAQASVMQALEEVCRQARCNYMIGKDVVTVLPQSFLKSPRRMYMP